MQLMDAVDEGKFPAITYTLLTLGKDRGYIIDDRRRRVPAGGRRRPPVEDDEAAKEFEAAVLEIYGRSGTAGDGTADDEDDAWPEDGSGETPDQEQG
jgi:hypothetical protein